MIISSSYFKGPLRIANGQDTAPNSSLIGNAADVSQAIMKYEGEVLRKCLGISLYNEFKSKFDIDATTGVWTLKTEEAGGVWDDLLTGKDYTISGVDYQWRGLIYTDSSVGTATPDMSLLAYYVYAWYVWENEVSHSGAGFVKNTAQKAENQSGAAKWAGAFNQFVKMTEYSGAQVRTLYDFISDMNSETPDTYADFYPERFDYVNRYGI